MTISIFARKSTQRWSPRAMQTVYMSKRFNEGNGDHMPWPFDKYKQPAAAKKWLTKYPAQNMSEVEEEFVYLDEIEDRIADHLKTQRQSDRYREAENEYAVLGDYNDIDRVYPAGLSTTSHGRGNLINPSHYIGPQFLGTARIYIDNNKIKPKHLLKTGGFLGPNHLLPPETPSLFKFWNFWHMFTATSIICVGKEYFILSSHDIWHFMVFYLLMGWFSGIGTDWLLWWKALRGQESYDCKFFPLQENVDNLFTLLDRLEKKPNLAVIAGKYHGYLDGLRERLVAKRTTDTIQSQRLTVNELLETKFKQEREQIASNAPAKLWRQQAMDSTRNHFADSKQVEKFNKDVFALFKNGGAKLGDRTNGTGTVAKKYETELKAVEKAWMTEQRKAGTLPWTMATEEERKSGALSQSQKAEIHKNVLNELTSKYHNFTPAV